MGGTGQTMHHLNCGTMCPHGAGLLTGRGGLLGRARLVCHCLLIEAADGLVLIDTGFGEDDVRNPRRLGRAFLATTSPQMDAAETARAQVVALGHDPADVRRIVTTHLDLDHAGGLADFPEAEVHLLGAERRAAMNPGLRERQRYIAAQFAHGPHWVEHEPGGEEWFGFQSVRILPGADEDVLLIPLPGHTRGHTGVAVRRGERWLLHCGDAYFNQSEVATPPKTPPGMGFYQVLLEVDGKARRQNLERLRELAARHGDQVDLICSHDAPTLDGA